MRRGARDILVPGGAAGGAGSFSAGVSTDGNTGGTTGVVGGRIEFVGSNNITLSQSINGSSATISIFGGAGGAGAFTAGMSNLGNTSGTTGVVQSQLVLAGGNNVTLSQSINGNSATITISAFTQTVQTQNFVAIIGSGANGNGTFTSGTLSLKAGNNITLSTGANVVSIHGPAPQTGISGLAATDTTYSSGTVLITGSNMVTVKSSGAGQTIIIDATQTVQTQNLVALIVSGANGNATFTSGTVSVKVGADITLSTGANVFSIYGNSTQSVQTQMTGLTAGLSNIGNTSGDTGLVSNRLVLAGGANITLSGSTNGNSMTISISGGAGGVQSNQTLGLYASSNTTGESSSSTFDARSVSFIGKGIASVGFSGSQVVISVPSGGGAGDGGNTIAAGTRTATTSGVVLFSNANGISFNLDTVAGSIVTASYTVPTVTNSSWTVSDANTSGTVARLAFTNLNGITLSLSTGAGGSHTVVGSYTVPTQTVQTLGIYLSGTTSGQSSSSTFDARSVSISGFGPMSLGDSAGSVIVSLAGALYVPLYAILGGI